MLSEWLTHTIFKHNTAYALFQEMFFFFLPFSPLPFFLSCLLPQTQPHVPALLPLARSLAITSVNTVVMQTANVKPPITQSVAFYLPLVLFLPLPAACIRIKLFALFSLSRSLFFSLTLTHASVWESSPCQQVWWLSIPFPTSQRWNIQWWILSVPADRGDTTSNNPEIDFNLFADGAN